MEIREATPLEFEDSNEKIFAIRGYNQVDQDSLGFYLVVKISSNLSVKIIRFYLLVFYRYAYLHWLSLRERVFRRRIFCGYKNIDGHNGYMKFLKPIKLKKISINLSKMFKKCIFISWTKWLIWTNSIFHDLYYSFWANLRINIPIIFRMNTLLRQKIIANAKNGFQRSEIALQSWTVI